MHLTQVHDLIISNQTTLTLNSLVTRIIYSNYSSILTTIIIVIKNSVPIRCYFNSNSFVKRLSYIKGCVLLGFGLFFSFLFSLCIIYFYFCT